MKTAFDRLLPFVGGDYLGTVVRGAPNEIAVFRAGRCVATLPLTAAEFEALVRAFADVQPFRPIPYLRGPLPRERLNRAPEAGGV
jgi:hypothetical protein